MQAQHMDALPTSHSVYPTFVLVNRPKESHLAFLLEYSGNILSYRYPFHSRDGHPHPMD